MVKLDTCVYEYYMEDILGNATAQEKELSLRTWNGLHRNSN